MLLRPSRAVVFITFIIHYSFYVLTGVHTQTRHGAPAEVGGRSEGSDFCIRHGGEA